MKKNTNIKNKIYDIVIIGGGIIGSILAYHLSKFNISILLLEKNNNFGDETSSGNSGVIHGGFDCKSNTLSARLNILGSSLWKNEIFNNLHFQRQKINSLILAFNDDDVKKLKKLYYQGIQNLVNPKELKLIDTEEIIKLEPLINKSVKKALFYNDSWVINPSQSIICLLKVAINNNVKVKKNFEVVKINKDNENIYHIFNKKLKKYKGRIIINAAGHWAEEIAKLANLNNFKLTARRGEYRVLSKSENYKIKNICFLVPDIYGKGVIVSPMLDNRVLVGPTADNNIKKEETRNITAINSEKIINIGKKVIPSLNFKNIEFAFAGSRPIDLYSDEFIIDFSNENKDWINIAGTKSPAIAAAPAIALEVEKLLNTKIKLIHKKKYTLKYKLWW